MPAKSASQRRLMAAALHGASFPKAEKLRATMSTKQLHDFATLKKPPMTPRLGNRYATHLRGK